MVIISGTTISLNQQQSNFTDVRVRIRLIFLFCVRLGKVGTADIWLPRKESYCYVKVWDLKGALSKVTYENWKHMINNNKRMVRIYKFTCSYNITEKNCMWNFWNYYKLKISKYSVPDINIYLTDYFRRQFCYFKNRSRQHRMSI